MKDTDLKAQMVQDRRFLHAHPEEGWCEFETTYYVVERLQKLGLKVLSGLEIIEPQAVMGRNESIVKAAEERAISHGVPVDFLKKLNGYTGAVAVLETGKPGPVTAIRVDIDCLPIEETTEPNHEANLGNYHSEYSGFSHACGHDGHTAVGLGVAAWLADHKDELNGTIKILFQPAEEGVRGAAAMAAKGIVDDVDWFVGAHIGCSAHLGEVGVSHQGYLATTKFDLEYDGIQAAAGSPEKGRSALMCAAATCMTLGSLPGHSQGISRVQIGKLISGTGRNIIAPHAYLQLEVRGETTEINDYMAKNVEMAVKGLADAYGVKYKLTRMGEAVTYKGDEEAINLVKAAASETEGVINVYDTNSKVGSEDCTVLIRRVQQHGGKAAFFYYGCNHPGHHRADFCIQDEQSLPVGLGVYVNFIKRVNGV